MCSKIVNVYILPIQQHIVLIKICEVGLYDNIHKILLNILMSCNAWLLLKN